MSGAGAAEFVLVAACCRWPRPDSALAAIRAAAAAGVDWSSVERVAARHGVAALVHDGLGAAAIELPPATRGHFAAAATAAAMTGLGMAREALRLQRAFDGSGIRVLFVKGTSLALLAYGTVAVKEAWDIDLLVAPAEAANARQLLEGLGYQMVDALPDDRFARYVAVAKEAILRHPALGVVVELHWRLTDNRRLLPTVDVGSPTQAVPLGSGAIRTLAEDALFAYLCVHGTVHAWSRLKWLADVAALVTPCDDIERLYRSAVALGAGRTPAVTLLLCAEVLHLALPVDLVAMLGSDHVVRALTQNARRTMMHGGASTEIRSYTIPWLRMMVSQPFFAIGAGYAMSELARQWTSVVDRTNLALPTPFGFIYHLIRIPLWLSRLFRRVKAEK